MRCCGGEANVFSHIVDVNKKVVFKNAPQRSRVCTGILTIKKHRNNDSKRVFTEKTRMA